MKKINLIIMLLTLCSAMSCSSGEVDVDKLVQEEREYLSKRQEFLKKRQGLKKSKKGDIVTVRRSEVPGF